MLIFLSLFLSALLLTGGNETGGNKASGNSSPSQIAKHRVVKITDGDTVHVEDSQGGRLKIRLLGIDCPETSRNSKCKKDKNGCEWQPAYGHKAKAELKKMVFRKQVRLVCGKTCKSDPYGRLLRYIESDTGADMGLQLVEGGFCADYSWKYPHVREGEYLSAQKRAQGKKLGIWGRE